MMLYLIFEVLYFELASLSNITNLRKRLDRKKILISFHEKEMVNSIILLGQKPS